MSGRAPQRSEEWAAPRSSRTLGSGDQSWSAIWEELRMWLLGTSLDLPHPLRSSLFLSHTLPPLGDFPLPSLLPTPNSLASSALSLSSWVLAAPAHTPLLPNSHAGSAACDESVCSQGRQNHGFPTPGDGGGAGLCWPGARCLWVQGGVGWLGGWWEGQRPNPHSVLEGLGIDGSVEVRVREGRRLRTCRMV